MQEKPGLHLNLDSPDFGKKMYEEFISNVVGAVVSKEKANGIPILPERAAVREVQPVQLTAYGITMTAGIRRDDLCCVGFESLEGWFSCKLDDTPGAVASMRDKGKGKDEDDAKAFIDEATLMHFGGSYGALKISGHGFKFSIRALKGAIKKLGKIRKSDVLDNRNIELLHSFGLICLLICECCRFQILGNTFMELADDESKELCFDDFSTGICSWGTSSYTIQYHS